MGETALHTARLAAVKPYGDPRQVREEPPVMADDNERGLPRRKFGFEPFDRGQVKLVRRLVEISGAGASTRARAALRASPPDSAAGSSPTRRPSCSRR
jgi:hypothetical protein